MKFSLTNKLTVGGLALVSIPLALLTFVAYRSASDGLVNAGEARLRDRANDTAYAVDQQMQAERRVVSAIGQNELLVAAL